MSERGNVSAPQDRWDSRSVLIVDEQRLVHVLVAHLAKRALGDVGVFCAGSFEDGLDLAKRLGNLELLLLNPALPRCAGLQPLMKFHQAFPLLPILVFAGSEDCDVIAMALRSGARGYLPKSDDHETLVRAIEVVVKGGRYFPERALAGPQAVLAVPAARLRGSEREVLTSRQSEVLGLKVKGRTVREIGHTLGISENTVKQHLNATYRALGVVSQAEARAAVALRGIPLG